MNGDAWFSHNISINGRFFWESNLAGLKHSLRPDSGHSFTPPLLFILFHPWLRLRALWRTFFFTLCLSTQMNPLCLKTSSPAARTPRGATLKKWSPATALCSCTRLWNVVCRLHQGFAKKPLYRPRRAWPAESFKKRKGRKKRPEHCDFSQMNSANVFPVAMVTL